MSGVWRPPGSPARPLYSVLSALAKMRATEVLPTPRVPVTLGLVAAIALGVIAVPGGMAARVSAKAVLQE